MLRHVKSSLSVNNPNFQHASRPDTPELNKNQAKSSRANTPRPITPNKPGSTIRIPTERGALFLQFPTPILSDDEPMTFAHVLRQNWHSPFYLRWRFVLSTLFIYSLSLFVAIVIPNLDKILAFFGAITGCDIIILFLKFGRIVRCFYFPGFILALNCTSISTWNRNCCSFQ